MDFEELYKLYSKDVYLFVLAMSRDPDIAEEITQDTFVKALIHIHRFQGNCSVKTWLCQIAKNTYLSYLKKQKPLVSNEAGCETEHLPTDNPSCCTFENAETIYIRKEEALSIYKVLHLLDEPYKEVFTLRTLGDLSFKEIGEIFGRKEGWARVTYFRAKQKIQNIIKEV